jgi:hypothetical protein
VSKLACLVDGIPAMVVGYGPGRKGRIHAIVVCEGTLRAVRLKDVQLVNVPADLQARVVPLDAKRA